MQKYVDIFLGSFGNYASYLWSEITSPSWHNYFYWLIAVSLIFWIIEIALPWRQKQKIIRRDFWLDGFYMFFNFFLFSLIGFAAVSNVFVSLFNDFLGLFGIQNVVAVQVQGLPIWAQLLLMLVIRDFIHYNVHRVLHRVPFLWEFHKVHHSVQEMGFAAHLRFHWMETVVYRFFEYLPLAMIGFGIQDFFIIHVFSLAVGHFNHSNFQLNIGPLKYLFNNPQMHIWHHAQHLPEERRYGVNFGLTFSFWDYIFKTNYIPENGKDIKLGFEEVEEFPTGFLAQITWPFSREKSTEPKNSN